MVDALTQVHRLLKPRGVLLDIHPIPERMLYEVRDGNRILFSAPDPQCYCDEYRKTEEALDEVVRRDLFRPEDTRQFDFFVLATSVSELRSYLKEQDAYFDEAGESTQEERQLEARLHEAMRFAGTGARAATHEIGRAARFKRMP